jgi:hypothetical protein
MFCVSPRVRAMEFGIHQKHTGTTNVTQYRRFASPRTGIRREATVSTYHYRTVLTRNYPGIGGCALASRDSSLGWSGEVLLHSGNADSRSC